jgi:type IV pilus assembly protein PilW
MFIVSPLNKSRGVTLIELLVGVAVGLIVVSGAIYLFGTAARSNRVTLTSAHLDQDLRAAMALLVNDIRRAGYARVEPGVNRDGDGVLSGNDIIFNPFLDNPFDVTTGATSGESADSCIVFSYNRDEDSPPVVDDPDSDNPNEKFGFRLRDGALEMRTSAAGTAGRCDDGTWEDFTEDTIEITALSFTLTHTQVEVDEADIADGDEDCANGEPCVCIREVDIVLTGRLKDAAMQDIQQTMQETVRIRNDKYLDAFNTGNPCRG